MSLRIKDNYPDGLCPDCGESISDDAQDGQACPNCEHVFCLEKPSDTVCKQYKATLELSLACEDEEQAIDGLLDYLCECVRHEDVTGFKIEEVKPQTGEWQGGYKEPLSTDGHN